MRKVGPGVSSVGHSPCGEGGCIPPPPNPHPNHTRRGHPPQAGEVSKTFWVPSGAPDPGWVGGFGPNLPPPPSPGETRGLGGTGTGDCEGQRWAGKARRTAGSGAAASSLRNLAAERQLVCLGAGAPILSRGNSFLVLLQSRNQSPLSLLTSIKPKCIAFFCRCFISFFCTVSNCHARGGGGDGYKICCDIMCEQK